jgi:hypothetical protein
MLAADLSRKGPRSATRHAVSWPVAMLTTRTTVPLGSFTWAHVPSWVWYQDALPACDRLREFLVTDNGGGGAAAGGGTGTGTKRGTPWGTSCSASRRSDGNLPVGVGARREKRCGVLVLVAVGAPPGARAATSWTGTCRS